MFLTGLYIIIMEYYYSKSKFSNDFFYKKIELGRVKHLTGIFQVSIFPYLYYSGKYYINSVVSKDNSRTVFLTMKSNESEVNFENFNIDNKFYISLSHDGKKFMIFKENTYGIILKS